MKRRFVALAITSALAASAFGGGVAAQEQVTLQFWTLQQSEGPVKEAQEAAVRDFEEEHGVTVDLITYPYLELQDKLLLAAASGAAPDVLLLDQIWVAQYAGAGYVDPIDDLMEGAEISAEDYFPGAWDSAFFRGQQYGVPFDVGVWALMYYNKAMFTEAGLDPENPPTTWEELNEAAAALTSAPDQYGIATWVGGGDAPNCLWDAWTFSGGGEVVHTEANETGLGDPAGVAALEQYKETLEYGPEGAVGRDVEDAFALFTSGRAAIMFYGEWGQDTIAARAPDLDYGVGLLPVPEGGTSVGCFGGFNLGISSNSQHKDLAWEFLQYSSGLEKQKEITMLTPAHRQAAEEYLQEKRVYPEIIFQQLDQAKYRPLIPNYPDFAEAQRAILQRALLDEASPQQALEEGVPGLNAILADAR
jgi:ABC-type glycerol-3-phosphate transport system substrate-binding protein